MEQDNRLTDAEISAHRAAGGNVTTYAGETYLIHNIADFKIPKLGQRAHPIGNPPRPQAMA